MVLDKLHNNGMMPDWLDFYESAVKVGWKPSGVTTKLAEAVGDVYGPEFRVEWEKRFKALIGQK